MITLCYADDFSRKSKLVPEVEGNETVCFLGEGFFKLGNFAFQLIRNALE